MTTIAIIYHSVTGVTQKLAESVRQGALSQEGVKVEFHSITGDDIREGRFENDTILNAVTEADAVVFGSPTYMGSVSAQFKAFADASSELWAQGQWRDKIAAGITVGSNYSGDQFNTIQYMKTFASQHGMVWVGLDVPGGYYSDVPNRLGAQGGLIALSVGVEVHDDDHITARHLGARVANMAEKLVHAA